MAAILNAPFLSISTLAGGFLTGFVWLVFWLREDPHPEPRRILLLTFLAGAFAVPLSLVLEEMVYTTGVDAGLWAPGRPTLLLLVFWAVIEEVFKFGAAWWAALRKPYFDEPVDAPIYLITAALGFAALENTFMLFNVFSHEFAAGFITANLRFIGATLLHTITASIVGFSIAYSFFHPEKRIRNVLGGLALAIVLHTLFNFFILKGGGTNLLAVFSVIWLGTIVVILSFEKIKTITY
ncbi:MAG: PrsW family intramembrane metalloprotease [Candidatus Niyogibacteria bacterium]|nr:PrsW family intramembrane metalloprotease [Candidatus Niyogibacteria bacterium]